MAQRSFRIFALPLARLPKQRPVSSPPTNPARPPVDPSSQSQSTTSYTSSPDHDHDKAPTPLILFQVSQPDEPPPSVSSSRWTALSITNRALNGATSQWLKLGEKPKDGWMYWFYAKGEGLMDKIEFEEWMLKGIHEGRGVKVVTKESGEVQQKIEIKLLRPDLKDGPALPPLVPRLHRMLAHRIPYHRKMMFRSLIFSPFTLPFAIIPVLPNFPLFYVLWRAWSHYRAWRGAHYLDQLLKLEMIHETPSKELTEVYKSRGIQIGAEGQEDHAPDQTSTESTIGRQSEIGEQANQHGAEHAKEVESMRAQEKGEKVGSGDTTATPVSMVYDPKTSKSSTLSESDAESEGEGKGKETSTSGIRHPSLLLTQAQIPLLQRTFDLRPAEIMDVTRAVEQADLRAKAIDRRNGMDSGADGKGKGGAGGAGTQWRGNLHR